MKRLAPALASLFREEPKPYHMPEYAPARAELRALLAVARAAERRQWSGEDIQGRVACVFCNGARLDGHFPRCVLSRLSAPAPKRSKGGRG